MFFRCAMWALALQQYHRSLAGMAALLRMLTPLSIGVSGGVSRTGARGGLAVGAGAVHAGGGAAGAPAQPVRTRGAHAPDRQVQLHSMTQCVQQQTRGSVRCGAQLGRLQLQGCAFGAFRASTLRRRGRSTTGCGSCGGTLTTTCGRWPSAPSRRCWRGASSRTLTPGTLPPAPCSRGVKRTKHVFVHFEAQQAARHHTAACCRRCRAHEVRGRALR